MYLGSWKIDDLLTFAVNTHDPQADGAATDADAVPSYRVYKDETTAPILTGNMAKLDNDNTTGFYSEKITLSTANGFEKGKTYTIYISATVNSVIGTISRMFQIRAAVDATDIAQATLSEPVANVEDTATFRSLAGAVSRLVNKVDILSNVLNIRKTDDSTIYASQNVSVDSDADPIVGVDTQ